MAPHPSILASFVKDKMSIGAWIYLWAFYFVPLIYISIFVPVPHCLDDCGLSGSSIHGIFQARVLEWVVIAFSS